MNIVTKLLALFVTLALVGCGIRQNIRHGESLQLDNESAVLFLGVAPGYRIHLLRGTVTDDVWTRPAVDVPEVNLTPEAGYIFVKVKPTTPDKRLGVSLIFPEGKPYGPCQGSTAPVFTVKAGTITYVGDLRYQFAAGQLRYDYTVDEEKARSFLKASYPGLGSAMTTIPMVPMKVNSSFCDPKTVTIPIYIRR